MVGLPQRQRVAAYAVILRDGDILLSRLAASVTPDELWTLPGGGLDHGEDPRDALVREIHEETGLEIDDCAIDSTWTIVQLGGRVACMRPVRVKESADAIVARVDEFLARDVEPELAGIRIVRDMRDLDRLRVPEFTRVYLEHEFGA